MTRERIVHMVAGSLVLIGLALAVWVNRWWLLLPTFVGLNLFQYSLSDWCLMDRILKKVGVRSECDKVCKSVEPTL